MALVPPAALTTASLPSFFRRNSSSLEKRSLPSICSKQHAGRRGAELQQQPGHPAANGASRDYLPPAARRRLPLGPPAQPASPHLDLGLLQNRRVSRGLEENHDCKAALSAWSKARALVSLRCTIAVCWYCPPQQKSPTRTFAVGHLELMSLRSHDVRSFLCHPVGMCCRQHSTLETHSDSRGAPFSYRASAECSRHLRRVCKQHHIFWSMHIALQSQPASSKFASVPPAAGPVK